MTENGKQKHGETQRLRDSVGVCCRVRSMPRPLPFLRVGNLSSLAVSLRTCPTCFSSFPELSCLQRSLHELLPSWTCPRTSPGLQPGRHPDRLQMSVGVGLHHALVLRVWRRRINGLYLRASLPGPAQSEESERGTSCPPPPPIPDPTVKPEQKGVRVPS